MDRYKCIIVDDEKMAADGNFLMVEQDPTMEVVAICHNGIDAIEKIDALQPDILLLDIEMPEISGFDVLRSVKYAPPAIIFITAHDQFALKAFEVQAIDYLLKPYTNQRFRAALKRAKELADKLDKPSDNTLQQLLAEELKFNKQLKKSGAMVETGRVALKQDGKIRLVPFEKILWIEGYDYYVKIHEIDHVNICRVTLKKLSEQLPDMFLRIHRSAIVNKQQIREVDLLGQEPVVCLSNGTSLKVSRSNAGGFKETMSKK